MAEHNLSLLALALAVVVGPAAAQFNNWLQASIANSVSASLSGVSHTGMTDSIVSGVENGADNLRKTLQELNGTGNNAVALAQDKVRDWYAVRLAAIWRSPVAYAQWLNPDVADDACPEDSVLGHLLRDAEREALSCVQDRVPRGIPDVQASVASVLGRINQYMLSVRSQGEECDEEVGLQGVMCKATRLAPMAGMLGSLGGDVGRVGGQIGVLVDGTARQCTVQASQSRESLATAAANAAAECIKATGGNAGNMETARYFTNWKNSNNLITIR
ncbi:uncharacterized protein LOC117652275 isoform X2 [Thrips palmi]|uniref:Uncharacterized protein LOC117652275 isoform X2 n=1 Tax=Thrips palmi TaxID=161013 RepID=A0A6P9A6R9_THRPL|nr:uncharacterized protein LOC117652275 isoform X2 [Thrips palmi]